ncbi:MAG: hypothetical protein IKU98_04275 [Bacteroidaceae bacterium]|nr:hypothetical protein [Bacteroidaceae bacterium]
MGIIKTEKAIVCGVEYGTQPTSLSSKLPMDEITSDGDFSVNITGLNANTTYYYRAYAVDAGGTYKYGDLSFFNINGGDYRIVDLGLSVKWAACNVGAVAPEEHGAYYAWGETTEKTNYDWTTYKWCKGEWDTMTKYCTDRDYGTVDNKTSLEINDDAAHKLWGENWRMPTYDEIKELYTKCKWNWTTINGVKGYSITGTNGNSIFLPAVGRFCDSSVLQYDYACWYWSSTLDRDYPYNSHCLMLFDGKVSWGTSDYPSTSHYRDEGYPIRPVYDIPVSVKTGDASDITDSGATLSGTVCYSDKSVTCGIIYGTSSTLSSTSGTKKSTNSSGRFFVNVTGLSPNTTYYYRAYVVDDGEYRYGEVRSFTTDLAITTGEATEVTYSAATLGGTVNSGGQSVTCGIIYGTSSKLSSTSGTLLSTTSSSEFSVRVMGLSSNTIYYYCAYVVVDGEYKYGEVLSFTTETIIVGDAIDLGLSVKWASWNVGADSPEGYGGYYAWGETEEKGNYDWSTYEWGSYNCVTKYCTISGCGIVDNKTTLEPEDDVAHILWGDGWRMPTSDELSELYSECSFEWATVNGVKGYKVTGPNGNSIFCPAAGSINGTELHRSGEGGSYWSSTLWDFEENCASAFIFNFGNAFGGWEFRVRYVGRSVRPVYGATRLSVSVTTGDATDITDSGATLSGTVGNSDKSVTCGIIYGISSTLSATSGTMESTSSSGEFSVNVTGLSANTTYYYCAYAVVDGEYRYGEVLSFTTASSVTVTSGDAIDLGLSVKWASCNVGAELPEEYGDYFAWGETSPKSKYNDDTSVTLGLSTSELKSRGIIGSNGNLTADYDAATVNLGDDWRMPTKAEQDELRESCTWSWTTLNGVEGYKVTSSNGNSIFLPAAGYRYGTSLNGAGSYGYYWSATPYSGSNYAYSLYFLSGGYDWDYCSYRNLGHSVRPVYDPKDNNSDVDLDGYRDDENWDAHRRR